MKSIQKVAEKIGLEDKELSFYGENKAKIKLEAIESRAAKGKLVLVTAMSPSPAGEGKTTTSIGLTDALNHIGQTASVALREPSMGPVFGMKGGGAGGGKAQVHPPEEINLHFTGDFHAITAAHNLLSAALDNHLHFGNDLNFDVRQILWGRVMDMNDRALRNITIGLGGKMGGVPRQEFFSITAASEIMAILALARSYSDLEERINRIVVGFSKDGEPICAEALGVAPSMVAILRDALLPNLAQTTGGSPAFIHAGPFANIAHGTSSILGTMAAMGTSDIVIQEAGFGADLGAEKFLNIFCPLAEVKPSGIVMVVTLRGIRYHGGVAKDKLNESNLDAIKEGIKNPLAHLERLASRGLPVVIALNQMDQDTKEETDWVIARFKEAGYDCVANNVYLEGAEGGVELAKKVSEMVDAEPVDVASTYDLKADSLKKKIEKIITEVYGGAKAVFSPQAEKSIKLFEDHGFGESYICMAKTPYSFSDDATAVGVAKDFEFSVREVRLSAGAGFVIPISGSLMTMPGLSRNANYKRIELNKDGSITLF